MTTIELLLSHFWIVKETDRDDYYAVKHDINNKNTKRFLENMLGWKLIHTERLLKLEKVPAHASSFMGIQEFTEISDYCFLCAILMFLEDREDSSQFLLSELIRYVETVLKDYMEVDWTSFSTRKSLVRALQFAESTGMLKTYEGNTSLYSSEQSSEVLYENTGLSRYFCSSFTTDIRKYRSWHDFEGKQVEEVNEERGDIRTNRVFRTLVTSPEMYWSEENNADALYLRNKRNYIAKAMEENIGGKLIVNHNNAAVVYEDCYPTCDYHPTSSMLSEIVLLVCHTIHEMSKDARKLTVRADDTILISKDRFRNILLQLKKKYQLLWSKEYREMSEDKYVFNVQEYMKKWLMIEEVDEQIMIYPTIAVTGGRYSEELEEKVNE